ncbi:histidinol-phosphate transaminase [Actinomadura yumaensis]|uniref:Histidinol-phosphate aminotransferase n=1 Tax=Actinomadura yumaensis TaxID=111807 RepID=A0ABW2CPE7_9ACTN
MPATTRPALSGLPPYRPGRTAEDLARELGLDEAIKLASNEMAFGPLPSVVDAVTRTATGVNRYPDMYNRALIAAIAERFEVDAERVTVGCGSVALVRHLADAVLDPGDETLFGWPTFGVYGSAAVIAGGAAVRVPLRDHALDVDDLIAGLTPRTRMVVVCTPNNPTSTHVPEAALRRLLEAVPRDVLVVLDEAYCHFVTAPDAVDGLALAREYDNVAVLRTFSKAYGLAGLRVGFCVADPAVTATLRKVVTTFSVSAVAQAAAIACLEPAAEKELTDRVAEVVSERSRVTERLAALGAAVPDSQANFLWLPLGERSATFAKECEKRGIILRAFPDAGVRVTIGAPHENDAFLEAAAALL